MVLPGCDAKSHATDSSVGVLVVHGFTGTPASVVGVYDAMADAGYHVEMPRLPGHGTTIDDLLTTSWADWAAEIDRSHHELARRADRIVVVGQSMGATLILAMALEQPDLAGVVCINPATQARDTDTMEMIDDFIEDGIAVVPGEGSDIADPDSHDVSYDGTPLLPLQSLVRDGINPITHRFGELTMPLRLFTSRQDHVVPPTDSTHLAATYGGPVDHTWLERSYHVATRDYEREFVFSESLGFVQRVTA